MYTSTPFTTNPTDMASTDGRLTRVMMRSHFESALAASRSRRNRDQSCSVTSCVANGCSAAFAHGGAIRGKVRVRSELIPSRDVGSNGV